MVMMDKVKLLKGLIEALDGFRIGRYTSLERVERAIVELNLKLPYDWEEIKEDIRAILSLPQTSPAYKRLEKLDRLATKFTRLNFVLLLLALAAYLARFWLSSLLLDVMALALIVVALIIVNAAYSLRVYVSAKVDAIYAEMLPELEKRGERLKAVVNHLIRLLRRELVARKYDLETFTLRLWVPDYSGIKIVRKPGRFSTRYVVRLA
ncbi:MAG: hypothetical protein QXI45_01755 [Thermofilaceae archaeon]